MRINLASVSFLHMPGHLSPAAEDMLYLEDTTRIVYYQRPDGYREIILDAYLALPAVGAKLPHDVPGQPPQLIADAPKPDSQIAVGRLLKKMR